MILTIVLILSSLVALNFLLLIFSCNKTSKVAENKKARVTVRKSAVVKTPKTAIASTQLEAHPLAATGS